MHENLVQNWLKKKIVIACQRISLNSAHFAGHLVNHWLQEAQLPSQPKYQ